MPNAAGGYANRLFPEAAVTIAFCKWRHAELHDGNELAREESADEFSRN
jgi:hypothetical protein